MYTEIFAGFVIPYFEERSGKNVVKKEKLQSLNREGYEFIRTPNTSVFYENTTVKISITRRNVPTYVPIHIAN